MPLVELDVPEGVTPAHMVTTPYGTHYFTEGRAMLSEEAADHLVKNGTARRVSGKKAQIDLEDHPGGDPYDRSEMAEHAPEGQQPALSPHRRPDSKLSELEKAHAGLPNTATGTARGTKDEPVAPKEATSTAAAKEEASKGPKAHTRRS